MKKSVLITLHGTQTYEDQESEQVELITEGTLEQTSDGWALSYEESDLTGLKGATTTFQIAPGKITLLREGTLNSQMVFEKGAFHESLYEMEFGALMITVCASKVEYAITEQGGTMDLVYAIEVEQSAAGLIEYHMDIRANE